MEKVTINVGSKKLKLPKNEVIWIIDYKSEWEGYALTYSIEDEKFKLFELWHYSGWPFNNWYSWLFTKQEILEIIQKKWLRNDFIKFIDRVDYFIELSNSLECEIEIDA